MVDQKNKKQRKELQAYLTARLNNLNNEVEKTRNELLTIGFNIQLLRKINIIEYKIEVCEKRLNGKFSDRRGNLELATPKMAF